MIFVLEDCKSLGFVAVLVVCVSLEHISFPKSRNIIKRKKEKFGRP